MFKYIFFVLSLSFLAVGMNAQNKPSKNQKSAFMVDGVCGMCKKRIESAALIPGVKYAEWDQKSGQLSVIFNDQKIDVADIHQAINKAGHDTQVSKADSASYAKLPHCCAYRDGVEKH